MHQKILVTLFSISLLFPSFSMSGDGGNVPVKQEKGTKSVQVQSEQVQQNEKNIQELQHAQLAQPAEPVSGQTEISNERVTIKDRLGIDTGMTYKEFEELKIDFIKKAKEIELPEGRDGFNSYFKLKINLNAYEELKNNGVDVKLYGFPTSKSHLEDAVFSDIVLIGEIYNRSYVENKKFYKSFYSVKVIEIFKGEEFIKDEFRDNISVLSKNGKNFFSSDETEMQIGEKRLFFLNYKLGEEDRFATRGNAERLIIENSLYSASGKILIGDLKSEIDKIKRIIEINDSKNFYNRSYRSEVEK